MVSLPEVKSNDFTAIIKHDKCNERDCFFVIKQAVVFVFGTLRTISDKGVVLEIQDHGDLAVFLKVGLAMSKRRFFLCLWESTILDQVVHERDPSVVVVVRPLNVFLYETLVTNFVFRISIRAKERRYFIGPLLFCVDLECLPAVNGQI